ncbi:MAG TPA: DUF4352 domain-containing protein [Candidatus Tumulicola sp.]|nr:DUF4352 domain-containing protein [Candidatus Tumulicola sp.]
MASLHTTSAMADQSVEVNGVVYTLSHVRATHTIGDPAMGGSRANGVYVIISLAMVNNTHRTRTVNPTVCTLTDGGGTVYQTSDTGDAALAMTGDKNASWLDSQVQPGVPRTSDIVFEVPSGKRSFTLTIPASLLSFGRSGKIAISF